MVEQGQFVFTAEHELFYNTKNPVPIADVIDALVGLEHMLRSLPRALEKATDIHIADAKIFVDRIEAGSLFEKIGIKLFFKSEEELDQFLEKVRTKLDGNPIVKGTLITAILAAFVAYGLVLAAKTLQVPTPNITANNNVIINVGAGEVGLTPEAFRAIVETAVTDKKSFAKSAVKLIKPARGDDASTIVLDGVDEMEIGARAIGEAPEVVSIEPIIKVEELKRTTLLIRAGDMDQAKSGWAGAVKDVTKRLPIELDPQVSAAQLFGRQNKEVIADVALTYQMDRRSGEMVARSIFVRQIY